MPAGFFIAVSAVALLHTVPAQTVFCLAGVSIQIVGFVLVARQHRPRWGRLQPATHDDENLRHTPPPQPSRDRKGAINLEAQK